MKYIILDTETANDIECPLVYDVGFAVIDVTGKVYASYSYVNADIFCDSENGAFIGGDTPDKVNDIRFENVSFKRHQSDKYPGGVYDRRPCKGEGFVSAPEGNLYIEQARNIYIDGQKIR